VTSPSMRRFLWDEVQVLDTRYLHARDGHRSRSEGVAKQIWKAGLSSLSSLEISRQTSCGHQCRGRLAWIDYFKVTRTPAIPFISVDNFKVLDEWKNRSPI